MTVHVEHRTIEVQGLRLHTLMAGPVEGRLAILLHGFPEHATSMEALLIELAKAGYRAIAPDQRGYNLSDKPQGLDAYTIDVLAKDVLGLMDALGREKAMVVGHDWGAAVTWWLALNHPDRVERAATINVPHPVVMLNTLKSSLAQLKRSWYMFFFQLPWLPELVLGRGEGKPFAAAVASKAWPGVYGEKEQDEMRKAWLQPGALTGMLNWYRAAFQRQPAIPADIRIRVPMMLVWGCKDHALGEEMAQPSIDLCDHGRLEKFPEATHWIQREEPQRVGALLVEWFDTAK